MRLLWLLLASSYHACADPELVEAAIRRMEERGQHDVVADVRRRIEEQEGKEDLFEQHYAAAVHLQRRAEAAEAATQQTADPQTATLSRAAAARVVLSFPPEAAPLTTTRKRMRTSRIITQ